MSGFTWSIALYGLSALILLSLTLSFKVIETDNGVVLKTTWISWVLVGIVLVLSGLLATIYGDDPHWSNPLPLLEEVYKWYYHRKND